MRFNQIIDKYYNWIARNLYCRPYVKYSVITLFKNGDMKVLKFSDYNVDGKFGYILQSFQRHGRIIDYNTGNIYYARDIKYCTFLPIDYKILYCIERNDNYYIKLSENMIDKINFKNRKLIPYLREENIIEKEKCLYDVDIWLKGYNENDYIDVDLMINRELDINRWK